MIYNFVEREENPLHLTDIPHFMMLKETRLETLTRTILYYETAHAG